MSNVYKPVKALRDVKAGKLADSDDVRVANIGDMIARMLELRDGLVELGEAIRVTPDRCPIVSAGHDHEDISKILTGLDKWIWRCPFCGQEFQD